MSAKEAVKIAIELDVNSGIGVDVLFFSEEGEL
jgi:hypothetical protein